jgi:Domain of unknown function (DUF4823)
MRILVIFSILIVLTSCADTHEVHRVSQVSQRLSADGIAYVSVPPDGRYGSTVYTGSGAMASQIVVAAFSRHMTRVEQASAPQTFVKSLEAAKQARATYLVAPAILHWEDRATEWSGRPDKVELRISVVDTASGKVIETAVVSGTSGLATFGGDHPQDLLPEPVQQYVDSLFPG